MAKKHRPYNPENQQGRRRCKICKKTVDKKSWDAISDGTRGWLHEGCEEKYLELLLEKERK